MFSPAKCINQGVVEDATTNTNSGICQEDRYERQQSVSPDDYEESPLDYSDNSEESHESQAAQSNYECNDTQEEDVVFVSNVDFIPTPSKFTT